MKKLCLLLTLVALLAPVAARAQYSAFDDPPNAANGAASGAQQQEISPPKPEIDSGDLPQGQSTQVLVMMRNNASAPIQIQKIELLPSSNITATLAGDQCSKEPLKPGIDCALTVTLKAESAGKYRVGLLLNHTGRTKISSTAIIGTVSGGTGGTSGGLPSNEIEAFPVAVDFGTAKGRTPLVRSIALRNSSTKPVSIDNIELAASPLTGFAVAAPDCKELAASQACVVTVTWSPQLSGKAEGVLVLRHSGPSGSLQIPLTGEYETTATTKAGVFPTAVPGQGLIVADRESVDFGTTVDGAASITVSLVNSGDKAVTLKAVKLAGSDNGLSLSDEDCVSGKMLDANQGCALTVNWLPRRTGPVIDDIQIIHDGARGVLVLPVRGTATQSVNVNLPLLSSGGSLPKLSNKDLDEGLVKDSKTSPSMLSSDASALNGYRVTSLSAASAVVTGPRGRSVVLEGVPQVVAGGHWIPHILPDGVELRGEKDTVLLLFDRALTAAGNAGGMNTFPASSGDASDAGASSSSDSAPSSYSNGTMPNPVQTNPGNATVKP